MHKNQPLTRSLALVVVQGQKLRADETVSVTTFRLAYAARRIVGVAIVLLALASTVYAQSPMLLTCYSLPGEPRYCLDQHGDRYDNPIDKDDGTAEHAAHANHPLIHMHDDSLLLHAALIGYMGVQGADLSTTMYLLGSRRDVYEANAILAPFASRPFAAGAFKIGVATVTSFMLIRAHKDHPRLAFWSSVALASFYGYVAGHNAALLRPVRGGA